MKQRRAVLFLLLSLAALNAAGCQIINDDQIAARMDPDGDGILVGEDCDDSVAQKVWYQDLDFDGFGAVETTIEGCEPAPDEAVSERNGDCDDEDATVFPEADEICDGADNDCDGATDEGECTQPDADGDGFTADADCDDANGEVNSDAAELCDETDNDCDGEIDEHTAADAPTWYEDADQDDFGNAAESIVTCVKPAKFAGNDDDCDDTDPGVYPEAAEQCDGEDDDCDSAIDEGFDADGDEFQSLEWCADQGGTDCDDSDASIYPGAEDPPGGEDNDCDGSDD